MALHEQSVGATDEWYTPGYVFEAMGDTWFDLDPAHPDRLGLPVDDHCHSHLAREGLTQPWSGFVWLNPPFGTRNGIVPWLEKFFEHGHGVALTPDRTSAPWWQTYAPRSDAILFVSPKIRFIGADGEPGRSPAQGTCLLGAGSRAVEALERASAAGLGVLGRMG
jgi:hypothetical protein